MAQVQNNMVLTEQEEDTMHGKYLVFDLDNQQFAIPISHVIDIINMQPITWVPNCPDYVKGITNLRGKVCPIVDVRMRFGKEPQEYHDRTCIIVVEEQGAPVGLIIDSVSEVITIDDENISPPPKFSTSAEARFIQGVGRTDSGVKLILDYQAVLGEDNVIRVEEVE
ncbi:MAG TPA: purine-binding chemotaxis protein CheW [Clostridiales bacterium]|nr:purine-binding chemotaxis protein CheW [Clostridiales bacterium]